MEVIVKVSDDWNGNIKNPELIRRKDCVYGAQDEYDRWYCSDLGCTMGDNEGNGYCSDAERKEE